MSNLPSCDHGLKQGCCWICLQTENKELKSLVENLQNQIKGHCERIAEQSEMLTKAAEKKE